jgi:hypothetical protein
MKLFAVRYFAGNIAILEEFSLQVPSISRAATMASVMRLPREHSECLHRSLSAVKFLLFFVSGSFCRRSFSNSSLMKSKAALSAERFNYSVSDVGERWLPAYTHLISDFTVYYPTHDVFVSMTISDEYSSFLNLIEDQNISVGMNLDL